MHDADPIDVIRRTRTVAIVGVSGDPNRPSHDVAAYLAGHTDWSVWYVNPNEDEILGRPVYASLRELPGAPDLVDVFRRRDELPPVVDDAIAAGAGAVWFQLGLRHPQAAAAAADAGLGVVQDRCLKTEHARYTASGTRAPSEITGR